MPAIPAPRDTLAGCTWLPRLIAKARLQLAGDLPPEYAARFCHPTGVDALFLKYFGLTKEQILTAAALDDTALVHWFTGATTPESIAAWNHTAENLGRPGFPLAERLPVALATSYPHLDPAKITSIFDALDADEGRG